MGISCPQLTLSNSCNTGPIQGLDITYSHLCIVILA
jgi:hypothetical protein